ncbi:MAG: DUF4388 domain-containing protein [Kiritimatiellia bacterium]
MKLNSILLLTAILLLPGFLRAADAPTGPAVEVIGDRFIIPVPDLQMTTQMGKPLRLYQELTNAYVTKVERPDGEFALCAFPKFDKKGKATAWITKDKSVFFGMTVPSMPAELTLENGEYLPVVGQTSRDWLVALERYGDRLTIKLPRNHPDLLYKKPVVVAKKKEPTQQEKLEEELKRYRTPDATQDVAQAEEGSRRSFLDRFKKKDASKSGKGRKIVIAKGEGNELTAEIDGEKLDTKARKEMEEKPADEPVADIPEIVPAETSVTENVTDEAEEAKPEDPAAGKAGLADHIQWIAIAGLGTLLLVVVGVKIVQKKKASGFKMPEIKIKKGKAAKPAEEKVKEKEKAPEPPPPPPPAKKEPAPAPATASDYFKGLATKVDFSGSLESFSLLDLIQFLNSTKETGDLHILDDAGEKSAELFFSKGEIIDAVQGKARGVAAIFSLVKNAKGSFALYRKKESGAKRTIEMPTMTLLLEASKNMDEVPAAPAPKPEPRPKPLSLKKK